MGLGGDVKSDRQGPNNDFNGAIGWYSAFGGVLSIQRIQFLGTQNTRNVGWCLVEYLMYDCWSLDPY